MTSNGLGRLETLTNQTSTGRRGIESTLSQPITAPSAQPSDKSFFPPEKHVEYLLKFVNSKTEDKEAEGIIELVQKGYRAFYSTPDYNISIDSAAKGAVSGQITLKLIETKSDKKVEREFRYRLDMINLAQRIATHLGYTTQTADYKARKEFTTQIFDLAIRNISEATPEQERIKKIIFAYTLSPNEIRFRLATDNEQVNAKLKPYSATK